MNESLVVLFGRYYSTGIMLDTNILLLYLLGRFDRERIERFKRTAKFTVSDFDILTRVLAPFRTIRTLPHVLAEVNSLAGQLPTEVVSRFRRQFANDIATLDESVVSSDEAARRREFAFLGLTDAAILADCLGKHLVLTDDLKLFVALNRAGIDAVNFTLLRPVGVG